MTQPNSFSTFCSRCGTQVFIGAQFCYTCGTKMPDEASTSVVQKQLDRQTKSLFLVFCGAVILIGAGMFFLNSGTRSYKPAFSSDVRFETNSGAQTIRGVTLAQYTQLRKGMSYNRVVAILGSSGTEISRVELGDTFTVMYKWDGEDLGANMNAMFQNDRLISKAQHGLK